MWGMGFKRSEFKSFLKKLIIIYLSALGLSWGTWDLRTFFCGMQVFFSCNMGDLVPWPEIKLQPPALGSRSLSHWTTREVPKRLFRSSSLSAIRVVSPAHLRLLIFLPAILIPSCESSSPAFLMMHSAYKLNKQYDSIQPWCTPFLIWNQDLMPLV